MTSVSPLGSVRGLFSRPPVPSWRVGSGADAERFAGPIRGELLGAEGLAEHARALARQQRIAPASMRTGLFAPGVRPLLKRLDETQRILEAARVTLNNAVERTVDVSPAGEWLLDNFYVIQEHLREIRASLPRGYYQELPKLATGTLAGYPRVYELAIGLIGDTEGHVEMENVQLFVREFQRGATLTMGELWAVPTMLRLGLMENIRRMALRTVQRLEDVEAADSWAQRLRDSSDAGPSELAVTLANFVSAHPPLTPTFVARFLQQLRTYQTNFTPLVWLEQWIAEDSLSAEDAVARSNQRLALTQVMIANSITSLRTIARLDWAAFVESASVVEAVLRRDPSGDYPNMTFATRDQYRHVIEDIAKETGLEERDVAQRAIELAQRASVTMSGTTTGPSGVVDRRMAHVGEYLIGDGRSLLEASTRFRPPWPLRLHRATLAHTDTVFFGGITLVTLLLLEVAYGLVGPMGLGAQIVVLLFAVIPANDIAINIIHQLVTVLLPPRILPKLDFEEMGIPPACRTAVVVPTILGSVDAVREALEHLEVQFLANRDDNLHFALLSDVTDAPAATRESDGAIVDAAIKGVEVLNARYPSPAFPSGPFLLFHRPRLWNAEQGVWMGWERKRGKLAEFNQFLRGGARDAFSVVIGDTDKLGEVRYVITLDSDTVLPRATAPTLVGTMAHPLNRAIYDPAIGRVVAGYGILQPRIGITLTSANRSRFAAIYSGHAGVDPYTTAVSDVYQDLYAEGSYTGKGIYDVDAFELATRGRFQENTLLSHDLIEGAYCRAALSTDVELYDDYPTRYLTFTRRKHRWIRGDWQLLPWLGRRVPGPEGSEPNRLSAVSRWKIFDNLRRSVVEIAQLVLLAAGWLFLPGSPLIWTALVLGGMASPWVFSLALALLSAPGEKSWRAYYGSIGRDALTSAQQYVLALVFLPHQAMVSIDAIVRTLWRLFVSHRHLLEWQTASQVERVMGTGSPREVWRRMWPAVAVAGGVAALVLARLLVAHHVAAEGLEASWPGRHSLMYAVITFPVIALWALSPAFANALSKPAVRRSLTLTSSEQTTALRYALLHWRYFDHFVSAETQWLAPDNYQDDPSPVIAARTSPTNVGLQLLGIVSAYDLGFLSCGTMIDRLELVFRSLERMQRFRGHFYNWYELNELRVLEPGYISTVDSGNLAGHLLALKQACLTIPDYPVLDEQMWDSSQVALTMAAEDLRGAASSGAVDSPRQWQAVLEAAARVRAVLASLPQLAGRAPGGEVASTLASAAGAGSRRPDLAGGAAALAAVSATAVAPTGGVGATDDPAAARARTVQLLVERLRTAERVLAQRGAPTDLSAPSVTPAPASPPPAPASGLNGGDGAGAGPTSADAPTTWLAWTRSMLEQHLRELAVVGVVGSGDGEENDAALSVASNGQTAGALPAKKAGPRSVSWRQLARTSEYAEEQVRRLDALAARAEAYVQEMDFRFLYDERRKLFSIGYVVSSSTLDSSFYDLLASEARLASYIAIAKGDVPVEHWFHLGRSLTTAAGDTALISWSGSMFEYMMPTLVMESFPFTLLDQTYHGAVARQIAYGRERSVPWGVSESAYNARDRNQNYQYRAFGVPDLALKRGLSRDLVVAPYATLLALPVSPHQAMKNLGSLEGEGALGAYGFRDAVDYTRPVPGTRRAVVGAYMAHHIGMGLAALNNIINRGLWRRRFHQDALVRSAELVLFERIPRRFVMQEAQTGEADERPRRGGQTIEKPAARSFDTAATPRPRLTWLGHAPYTVMLTNGGGGYSHFEGLDVTRWRADGTLDNAGQWCYLKDVTPPSPDGPAPLGHSRVWSAAHQPTGAVADWYRVTFATDRATFHRRDGDIETRLEATVVPDDAAEVRRITLTNLGTTVREIEVTSYAEVVLGSHDADRQQAAFTNLFVETEWQAGRAAILASRRARSSAERGMWGVHVAAVGGGGAGGGGSGVGAPEQVGAVTCETDRARFLGRCRGVRRPVAIDDEGDGPLSGTTGAVLDPVFALRVRVRVAPARSVRVAFTTLVAADRDRALEMADRYHDPYSAQRALDLSWMEAQVELRELGVSPVDAALYQDIAGYLLYSTLAVRPPQKELVQSLRGQDALWAHGISGDNPILLASVETTAAIPTVRELLAAHHYWRLKGIVVDLVLINVYPPTYLQELQDALLTTVMGSSEASLLDKPGGVFIRRKDLLPPDDLAALRASAGVVIDCEGGLRLAELVEVPEALPDYPAAFVPQIQTANAIVSPSTLAAAAARAALEERVSRRAVVPEVARPSSPQLMNGLGAMADDGSYDIVLGEDATTPAPWANVIANEQAGLLISESGSSCTWVDSSYFYRLTPWHNDPVSDACTDAIYIRDDETGEIWSVTSQPVRHDSPYFVRHSPGSTEFRHTHAGIAGTLAVSMAKSDPVKLALLTVANETNQVRRLTITSYVEWVLGVAREVTRHHVRTSFDRSIEAIFAQNVWDPQFAGWVAFTALSEPLTGYTADRREFLGRNGDYSNPAALHRVLLAEMSGMGGDPCGALQCGLTLGPGQSRTLVVMLGAARGQAEARQMVAKYKASQAAASALAETQEAWRTRLSMITVRTPDPEFDSIMNGWLLYQALSCRMWGRTALYQSSGAYGFRDQLQDTLAFAYSEQGVARAHLLRCAARQFKEGDVQHWWHPQTGQGVRTHISDDLAWLPFVVDRYVRVTGDESVLDERTPFLSTRLLEPQETELYDRPDVSGESGTVYEHCLRALRKAATVGGNGLPLIGGGDWNDGFNRVGIEGKGESVWLAWFLITGLRAFAVRCDARGDKSTADDFRARADAYSQAVEQNAWDGDWYRRAYFDDGTPLGTAAGTECTIDSIAQSWGVISRAAQPDRMARAMASAQRLLVREDARLIMLLTPPFDRSEPDPGYIKGYLPGVRENGAQYTHAATWAVLAVALEGDGDRAFHLYQMLNPLTHTKTRDEVARYKVEPYVVAADVYTATGHLGRGGWTWYTGSASWMYRVGLEAIMGFDKVGATLRIDPCVPRIWTTAEINYRYKSAHYKIEIQNPAGVTKGVRGVTLDGRALADGMVPLADDGREHVVVVEMGPVEGAK